MRLNLDFLKKRAQAKAEQIKAEPQKSGEEIKCCGSSLSWFNGISRWFCRKCGKEFLSNEE